MPFNDDICKLIDLKQILFVQHIAKMSMCQVT